METREFPGHLSEAGIFSVLSGRIPDLESFFGLQVSVRGNRVIFRGDAAGRNRFHRFLEAVADVAAEKKRFTGNDLSIALHLFQEDRIESLRRELTENRVFLSLNGKEVHPKTLNQKKYLSSIRHHDLVFAIGPAGTGKTFLAIAMALHQLLRQKVRRIVLTRPVVEAGENLGFLPGDIKQKVNPYFRPLYDSLYHLIGFDRTSDLIEKEVIEIAPLAYMRGRTIDEAFIILDEGQNTVNSQMKMFLTRFGKQSRVIVTADTSQVDLPHHSRSGIFTALKILRDIKEISFVFLDETDIVRHQLVQKIIHSYQNLESGE